MTEDVVVGSWLDHRLNRQRRDEEERPLEPTVRFGDREQVLPEHCASAQK